MKKRILCLLLALLMSASLLVIPAMADSSRGASTKAALNMRSQANTNSTVITVMPKGSDVLVLSTSNGWSRIIYDGKAGYASAEYLTAKTTVSGKFGTGTITGNDVRMRSGAGTGSSIVGTYDKGVKMTVTGASGNWYAVSYNGKSGYVSADYMSVSVQSSTETPAPSATTPVSGSTFTGKIIGTSVRMRSGPGTSYSVLGSYSNGVTMTVTGSKNGWYAVNYNGKAGYVSGDYMRVTPKQSYSSASSGTVNGSNVRMRMGPSTSFSIVTTYSSGKSVKITGVTDNWYEVSIDGKYGYMSKDYVKVSGTSAGTSPVKPAQSMDAVGTVNGNCVRMRSGPSTSYAVIGYYNRGTQVKISGKTNNWYYVSVNGTTGYISADYVKTGTVNALGNQIVATAKEYLGTPYVWGGTSPRGFDCSGFVYYVYQQYGYPLQRRASLQYAYNGVSVSKSELQPGDLVFFSDSVDPIGHVGMYIGNGQFIHASSGQGCVCITALEGSSYYINHYTGAKRII